MGLAGRSWISIRRNPAILSRFLGTFCVQDWVLIAASSPVAALMVDVDLYLWLQGFSLRVDSEC